MTNITDSNIPSYAEQIYIFRKNVFLLRAIFYFILFLFLLLFNKYGPSVLISSTILFVLNLTFLILLVYRSIKIEILIYTQQILNLVGILSIVFLSGKGHSIFILLFITEGFFCGIMYNLKCLASYFLVLLVFFFYIIFEGEGYTLQHILTILLSIFSTISSFLIIREQDRRRTEMISCYLKLEKLNSRLTSITKLRKNFMDIAYHDMKSPLSTVVGFLQNILAGYGGPITEKQKDWLNRCIDRLDTLSRQVNDLYFLANIESTDFNEIKKRCDVLQEIELAIAEVSENFNKKNQKFIKNVPSSIPWMVLVPILFRQCLVNLLGNASKYTPSNGTIRLDVDYDENWLTIKVIDTGIGIPDEFKPRIFDEFFRVKNTVVDNQKVSGTGLGLTIVKSIVDGHGGTIEVMDNKPQGTVFIVRFPMVEGYKEA